MIKSKLNIVCPSKGRADNLMTKKLFVDFNLIVVVPKNELEDYRKHNPEKNLDFVGRPDYIRGIADSRWWIMNNYDDVFMVDDDVDHVRFYNIEKGKAFDTIRDPEHVNDIIQKCYLTAKQMGAKQWGFGNHRQPLPFNPHKPFSYTGFINASFCGYMKDHGLHYDENDLWINGVEDYYFSALNAYYNRFNFIDTRYTFLTVDNFCGKGGNSHLRKASDMKPQIIELMKLFGDAIHFKGAVSNTKQKVQEGEGYLRVPY